MSEKNFKEILSELKVHDIVVLSGEKVSFAGYIKSINMEEEFFELEVEASDDDEAIGQIIPIGDMDFKTFFNSLEVKRYKKTRQDILDMIDLSLAIKNEHLFMHYTNELSEYDKKEIIKKQKAKYFMGGRM